MLRRSVVQLRNLTQKRFASCLVVAEHDNKGLGEASFAAISAASQMGPTTVLVAGHACKTVAEEAAKCKGVDKVVIAECAEFEFPMPETLGPYVAKMSENFSHVVMGASSFGKNLTPRAAVLRDCAIVAEITDIISEDTFIRPMYAGNALATVQSSDPTKFITVRGTSFPPLGNGGTATIENATSSAEASTASHVGFELSNQAGPSLTSATNVVSGGRGMASGENFKMLYELAEKLPDCAVGASRAAVDAGFVGNDLQVGQTGKVVAPTMYMAVGISGAIQHLAGMKDSKTIVAVNKDVEAPIFQVADYGVVGDLFNIVPELNKKL